MNREDIIRMAKDVWGYSELMTNDLANAYDMGVANEREQILAFASSEAFNRQHRERSPYAYELANAIQARGQV